MTQNCNCHGSGGQYSQTVAATLERPRYSPGLILEDSDLSAAVDYTRELSRLLFRNLFGCGVICGLNVKIDSECGHNVTVSHGLALDGSGDPLQLPAPVTIAIDKKQDEQISKDKSAFWVVLCGKEKLCQPRALVCEADDYDGVTQATRIRALSEVSLSFEEPKCACGCRTDTDGKAPTAPAPAGGTGDPCHMLHETRVDCAADCGCGSACDCGCCVLLAKASFAGGQWTVQHKGVRRLVRAALIADRDPNESPPPRMAESRTAAPPPPAEIALDQPAVTEPTILRADEAAAASGQPGDDKAR